MVKDFHVKERITLDNGIEVCPDCRDHVQGEPMEVFDCKNVFYVYGDGMDKIIVGQCCCYSEVHGKLED